MPTWLIVIIVISWILFAIVLALPWLLKRRGVEMRRTKFGPALIFEAADDDGSACRRPLNEWHLPERLLSTR